VPDEPTTEQIEALLRLQAAETTIRRLEHQLEQLPEQAALDVSTVAAGEVKSQHDALRVEIGLVEAEMRRLEGEIGVLQQRREADQQRMYGGEITNPKELQAVRSEIANIGGRIERLEDELLEVMERREELGAAAAELQRRAEQLAGDRERLEAARDEAAKEVLAQLAQERVERDADRGRVPDDLLARYEAKKQRHGGLGIGALDGRICTACRLELTPLERSELLDGPPVGICPQCQRLLVALEV
jgi:uncharacterized protein